MGSPTLGYASCEDCRGSGKTDAGTRCPTCHGRGMIAVYEPGSARNPDTPQPDRRRSPRYLTDLPLIVSHGQTSLEGYCNHISEGGLGAFLPNEVPVDSAVVLHFAVPSHPAEMQVQAVVRYQIGFQHGLEFLSLTDTERMAIRQFCTELPSIRG